MLFPRADRKSVGNRCERSSLGHIGDTVDREGIQMVADDKDHGLTGVHVDTLVTFVVSRMMVDAVSSPVAGYAAALSEHIGVSSAGDSVKIHIAMISEILETCTAPVY